MMEPTAKLRRYYDIFARFKESTMVPPDAYVENLRLAEGVLARLKEGCIVECGTWCGGMSAGLMVVGGPSRTYHFFDSFKGLPAAGGEDGEEARRWQENKIGPRYFNNCTASIGEFWNVISAVESPPMELYVHEGFFEETFPRVIVPPIAVLRLDVDWYESTIACLEKFWDMLLPGALVLIDDYYDWAGCRKAVHAFLARRNVSEAIRQSCQGEVCHIFKI